MLKCPFSTLILECTNASIKFSFMFAHILKFSNTLANRRHFLQIKILPSQIFIGDFYLESPLNFMFQNSAIAQYISFAYLKADFPPSFTSISDFHWDFTSIINPISCFEGYSFHFICYLCCSFSHRYSVWYISSALTFCLMKTTDFISLNIFNLHHPMQFNNYIPPLMLCVSLMFWGAQIPWALACPFDTSLGWHNPL